MKNLADEATVEDQDPKLLSIEDLDNAVRKLRSGIDTLDAAIEAASAANKLAAEFGEPNRYMSVDRGAAVSPRYSLTARPQIGDKVSEAFNGDYTPAGEIVAISATMSRVETSTGEVFTRRKPYKASIRHSAVWMIKGSDMSTMVPGHITRRNESF